MGLIFLFGFLDEIWSVYFFQKCCKWPFWPRNGHILVYKQIFWKSKGNFLSSYFFVFWLYGEDNKFLFLTKLKMAIFSQKKNTPINSLKWPKNDFQWSKFEIYLNHTILLCLRNAQKIRLHKLCNTVKLWVDIRALILENGHFQPKITPKMT